MPNVSLNPTDVAGTAVTDYHFGINATADYQRFSDFRNTVDNLIAAGMEVQSIRYPGGVETERYFDITNWDNSLWDDGNGNSGTMIPMSQFMAYCVDNGIQPVVVIPISNLLTYPPGGTIPTFDPNTADDLKTFVKTALEMMGDTGIAAFELGNEYWDTMGAEPYADIAGHAAIIVQQAIDEYMAENNVGPEFHDPDILAQMFVDPGEGGLDPSALEFRNANAIKEFTLNGGIEFIDGVTAHFYFKDGKNAGAAHEHTYENLQAAMSHMYTMFQAWQSAVGNERELSMFLTEWNTHFNVQDYLGLQAVAPILEMFTQHLTHGVDNMQLWSMQFNAAAIADREQNVNFLGDFLTILQDKTLGMAAMDIDINNSALDIHAFSDGDTAVMFITSLQSGQQSVNLTFDALFPFVDDYSVTNIGVDPASLDGFYQSGQFDNNGWLPHQEPDADLLQTAIGTFTGTAPVSVTLGGFELVMIEFDLGPAADIVGTGDKDTLTGTLYSETIIGGDRADVINGGGGDDTIIADGFGASGTDTVNGGAGDDLIYGGNWNDLLFGDEGNDTIFGGDYHDEIHGGQGDDTLYGEIANDTLYGDNGNDILDGGRGMDTLFGGADNDTLKGYWGNDTLHGDDGNDTLLGDAHHDTLYGGKGNDHLNGQWGNDILDGGAGNDLIKGATGNDDLTGGAGADTFQFTVFHDTDVIRDFEDGIDVIEIIANPGTGFADLQISQSGSNTIVSFTQSGETLTITLDGIAAAQIDASDFIFT